MSKHLMKDFPPVSAKEWKQKIQVDLKGENYESLITQTPEGIHIKPFYHQDDRSGFTTSYHPESWKVTEKFVIDGKNELQGLIENSLQKGSEAIWLECQDSSKCIELLEKIDFHHTSVFVELKAFAKSDIDTIIALAKNKNINLGVDIIGNLAETGNWYENLQKDHDLLNELIQKPNVSLAIHLDLFQNAGANMVQQLAYSLGQVNEYYNHCKNQKIKPNEIVVINAVGSNYFFEVAKIKALRNLIATLSSAYGFEEKISVYSTPSHRNKTVYDYNVNMLRTTTECMSAIIGGSDFVANMSYDGIFHHPNEFGSRISRNQLLVLKSESYFNELGNVADGSYYIEEIIDQLSEKAWSLFKEIEKSGGFLTQLKEGTIQRKIKEQEKQERESYENGKKILVGSNKYLNKEEKVKETLDVSPFLEKEVRKTLLEPILKKRLAENIEKDRLNNE
ncbi:methylmalonyl-CoA mutase subunit beta [Mesonia sp. K7]|uniref:methylmalonyl-CoA mutase subunit beta n=1 Tax=Mesonia sp. K7 TaxID=2218606 RepID=UPI000DAA6E5B|nr:methylmalonyl-CoA mutase subunit beta [Mesonia sp. K7]PZD78274.1 methylmalonyl-CoA mutase [Mesonia sp. K7]